MSTNIMITIFNFGKSYKYIYIENVKGEIGVCVCERERERDQSEFSFQRAVNSNNVDNINSNKRDHRWWIAMFLRRLPICPMCQHNPKCFPWINLFNIHDIHMENVPFTDDASKAHKVNTAPKQKVVSDWPVIKSRCSSSKILHFLKISINYQEVISSITITFEEKNILKHPLLIPINAKDQDINWVGNM